MLIKTFSLVRWKTCNQRYKASPSALTKKLLFVHISSVGPKNLPGMQFYACKYELYKCRFRYSLDCFILINHCVTWFYILKWKHINEETDFIPTPEERNGPPISASHYLNSSSSYPLPQMLGLQMCYHIWLLFGGPTKRVVFR